MDSVLMWAGGGPGGGPLYPVWQSAPPLRAILQEQRRLHATKSQLSLGLSPHVDVSSRDLTFAFNLCGHPWAPVTSVKIASSAFATCQGLSVALC